MYNINMPDKYKAIWLSHSSYENYIKCPRLYYLANIYKDPKTKNKITITSPYIALGVAVHNVLEPLANMPSVERHKQDLISAYDKEFNYWRAVDGDYDKAKGGWQDAQEEHVFYERGLRMIENIVTDMRNNKSILLEKAIRPSLYYQGDMIPNIYLDEKENIILCGSIDWIVYSNNGDNRITVLDFKTGTREEKEDSHQLLIYKILFESLQNKWKVNSYAYYYLENNNLAYKDWNEEEVNNRLSELKSNFVKVGSEIRDKRYITTRTDTGHIDSYVKRNNEEENFLCPLGPSGCRNCQPYERIIKGQAKYVGLSAYGQDMWRVI